MAEVKLTVNETKLAIISPKSLVVTGNTLKTDLEKDITTANTTTYATEGEIQEVNSQLITIAN